MTTLWAVYLTVCIGSSCTDTEVQRFDPPDAAKECAVMLELYKQVPSDGRYDSATWQCKPLHSQSV